MVGAILEDKSSRSRDLSFNRCFIYGGSGNDINPWFRVKRVLAKRKRIGIKVGYELTLVPLSGDSERFSLPPLFPTLLLLFCFFADV